MATIQNDIYLRDHMTATLNTINSTLLSLNATMSNTNKQVSGTEAATNSFGQTLSNFYGELASKVYLLKNLFQGLSVGTNFIDTLTRTDNRLDSMLRSGESLLDIQQKINVAANDARASYTDMAKQVAQVGILSGGVFKDTNQIIRFNELVAKTFALGGADTIAQKAGTYQLVQALGAGALMGDEFRSITENAPLVRNAIADYLGLAENQRGVLKQMAADGEITSDIIVNAMFAAGQRIDRQFSELSITIGERFTVMGNTAIIALKPLTNSITEMLASKSFEDFYTNTLIGINYVGKALIDMFKILVSVTNFITDNWDKINPILRAVALGYTIIGAQALLAGKASAFAAFLSAQAWIRSHAGLMAISMATVAFIDMAKELSWQWQVAVGIVTSLATALTLAKLAMLAFNSAFLKNPIGLVIAAVVGLIYALYEIVKNLITLYDTNQQVAYSMIATWVTIKTHIESVVLWIKSAISYMSELLSISSDVGKVSAEVTTKRIQELSFNYVNPLDDLQAKIKEAQGNWKPLELVDPKADGSEALKQELIDAGKAGGIAFSDAVKKPTKEFLGDLTEYTSNVLVQKITKLSPVVTNHFNVKEVNNMGDIKDFGDIVGESLLAGLKKVY